MSEFLTWLLLFFMGQMKNMTRRLRKLLYVLTYFPGWLMITQMVFPTRTV